MDVNRTFYGVLPDGRTVDQYQLTNRNGMSAAICTWGGTLLSLWVPNRRGELADVVLGHSGLDAYIENPGKFGAVLGRNSGRIRNAAVEISGKTYQLTANMGNHNIHGGPRGLSYRLFDAEAVLSADSAAIRLSLTIPNMDDEFPGNLSTVIEYILDEEDGLTLSYQAVSDADTLINLSNHAYFNLRGHDSGSVLDHRLQINADYYMPNDCESIPTGEIAKVEHTPFDFRAAKAIGRDFHADHDQLRMFHGYDLNYLLNGQGYRQIARAEDPQSGRVMTVSTDLPCVQFYTANKFPINTPKKGRAHYENQQAFCLETQYCPNAVEMPWLRSPIYLAGQEYRSRTCYRFSSF